MLSKLLPTDKLLSVMFSIPNIPDLDTSLIQKFMRIGEYSETLGYFRYNRVLFE